MGKKIFFEVVGIGLALCISFPILADNPFEGTNVEQAHSMSKEKIKLAERNDGSGKRANDLSDSNTKSAIGGVGSSQNVSK